MFLNLKKSKNVLKISTGAILAQLISLITLPFLTVIYGPEIIGIWSFLNSIVFIVNSFSDFGLINLIMTCNDDNLNIYFAKITSLIIFISFFSSILFSTILSLLGMNDFSILFSILYIFLASFLTQLIQLSYTILNRNEEYNVLMFNPIINYGVFGLLAITFGFLGLSFHGYFIAYIFALIITMSNMYRKLPKLIWNYNLKESFQIITNNPQFVSYQLPSNVLNNIKNQIPVLLIKFFWGSTVLGFYSITIRILQIPISFIAKAIGRVFYSKISSFTRQLKSINRFVTNNLTKGIFFGALPTLGILIAGDYFIVILLGDEWQISGDYLRLLAIQYYLLFITNTIQGLPIVLNKQNYALIFNFTSIIIFMLIFIIGGLNKVDFSIILIIYSFSTIFLTLLFYGYLLKAMNESPFKIPLLFMISIFIIIFFSIYFRFFLENIGFFKIFLDFSRLILS